MNLNNLITTIIITNYILDLSSKTNYEINKESHNIIIFLNQNKIDIIKFNSSISKLNPDTGKMILYLDSILVDFLLSYGDNNFKFSISYEIPYEISYYTDYVEIYYNKEQFKRLLMEK